MSYQIFTEVYEGPIDLFYDLVVADRIDSSTLSLTGLVERFLSELAEGTPTDLEHVSEFLLVLAFLCRLKARRMLSAPDDFPDEEPTENPDRELWYQLAQLTFGQVVEELTELLESRSRVRSREAGPDWSKISDTPPLDLSLDPGYLARLANEVFSAARAVPDLDHLALDLPTVEQAISDLWRLLSRTREGSFEDLSHHCGDRAEQAVWFMGLMELAHQGRVSISQAAPHEDIRIRPDHTPARPAAMAAESG